MKNRKKPKREDYPIGFGGEIGFNGAMELWEEQKERKTEKITKKGK